MKWAMLRKMDLDGIDFSEMSNAWRLGADGKQQLKKIYDNFRGQLVKRLDEAILRWFDNEGKDYDANRQNRHLSQDELREIYHNREQFRRIWLPIDILEEDVWMDQNEGWLKQLKKRAATYWSNRVRSLKTEEKVGIAIKMKW